MRSNAAARRVAAIGLVGLALTASAFVIARHEVDQLARERTNARADSALISISNVMSKMDSTLASARGAALANPLDPARIQASLLSSVPAKGSAALIAADVAGPKVVTSIGPAELLPDARAAALAAGPAATLLRKPFTRRELLEAVAGATSEDLRVEAPV
jgi:hypothetical protein